MKPLASPSAFARLREVFRPPQSFGTGAGTSPLRTPPILPPSSRSGRPSVPGTVGPPPRDVGWALDQAPTSPASSRSGQSGTGWPGEPGAAGSPPRDVGSTFDEIGLAADDAGPVPEAVESPSHAVGSADESWRGSGPAWPASGLPATTWPESEGRGRGRLRIDPGLPGVRVLALAGLLAALLAGVLLWWSRPQARPAPAPILRPAAQPATAASPVSPANSTAPSPAQPPLVVDVAGKVRHPGVVSLPPGARVIDAIDQAGGVRPGVKTGTLNLARRVTDGEQILVGVDATPSPAAPPGGAVGPPGAAVPAAPVDLNSATAAQLDQLPGVGPVLAQRIVDYRTQHGGFRTIDELRQVSGIGDAKFADLRGLVRV